MPFQSKRQQRWAHATDQPFAARWDKETDFDALKDAGTVAGTQAHGPGGLMATPGAGGRRRHRRKWGQRLKDSGYSARAGQTIRGNLARGSDGKFTAAGNASAAKPKRGIVLSGAAKPAPTKRPATTAAAPKPKKGGGGKGKAPKTPKAPRATPEQRRTANRDAVKQAMADQDQGLAPKGFDNLMALAGGKEPDQIGADGLIAMGMAERGADGTLRLTSAGRGAVAAANRGDAKGAIDAVSRGAEQAGKRAAAGATPAKTSAEKKPASPIAGAMQQLAPGAKPEKAGGGGGGKKPSADEKRAQQTQERSKRADATAAQVGISAADVQSLRQAAESGGASSPALASLGLIGADGMTTDQGRRALIALERGDVRGYNAALQDAKARMGRETAAAQRRQQVEGARTRREQERTANQQRRIETLKRRALTKKKLTTAEIETLQDAGVIGPDGRWTGKDAGTPGDYLVVEDPAKRSTWHLRVKRGGAVDHRLMGAAWAALHGGYRGNTYEGPQQAQALSKLRKLYASEKMEPPAEKSFTVFKDHTGRHRWIARTTTAYRDRDGEIISVAALEADAARMTATGQYGPLRYWHVGQPDPFDPVAPWGPGIDIGDCDFSIVIGRTSIESGTFKSAEIGQAFAESADDFELSPGFFHPLDQPGPDGVFHSIRRFERSPVPIKYGRASNLFTGLTVKEHRMDPQVYEQRVKAYLEFAREKGVPPDVAAAPLLAMEQSDKDAQTRGITYKSEDTPDPAAPAPPEEITIGGVVYTVKAAPAEPVAVETQADMPMEDMAEGGMEEVGEEMAGDYLGDMSWDEFAGKLASLLAPVLKMQEMVKAVSDMGGELKSMYGGVAAKEAGVTAELAALKAQQAELTAKIAAIEGNQPATILPDEVAAALKSAGPATPAEPDAIDIPTEPDRMWASIAARMMPDLYKASNS